MKSIVSYCFDRFLKSVGELRCASRESKVHLRIKDSKKDQVTREKEKEGRVILTVNDLPTTHATK